MKASIRKLTVKEKHFSETNHIQTNTNKSLSLAKHLRTPTLPCIQSNKKLTKGHKSYHYRVKDYKKSEVVSLAQSLQNILIQKRKLEECLIKEQVLNALRRELRLRHDDSKLKFFRDIEAKDIENCTYNNCSVGNTIFHFDNRRLKLPTIGKANASIIDKVLLDGLPKNNEYSLEYSKGIL